MAHFRSRSLAIAALLATSLGMGSAFAQDLKLTGDQEVPPNTSTAVGAGSIRIDAATVNMPELFEGRAEGEFALGVRPENVSFADSSPLRGRVIGAEYLGTTQIVTVDTASGRLKARLPSAEVVRVGEAVGLALRADRLSLFDEMSGQALQSALDDGARRG